ASHVSTCSRSRARLSSRCGPSLRIEGGRAVKNKLLPRGLGRSARQRLSQGHSTSVRNGRNKSRVDVVSTERPNFGEASPVKFDERQEAGSEEVRAQLPDDHRGRLRITILGTDVIRWR